jgi:hypothetical protein
MEKLLMVRDHILVFFDWKGPWGWVLADRKLHVQL